MGLAFHGNRRSWYTRIHWNGMSFSDEYLGNYANILPLEIIEPSSLRYWCRMCAGSIQSPDEPSPLGHWLGDNNPMSCSLRHPSFSVKPCQDPDVNWAPGPLIISSRMPKYLKTWVIIRLGVSKTDNRTRRGIKHKDL